jgi:hypothetical protein
MIHIATVHWPNARWVDIQLRYLERHIEEPYRVYAWIDGWSAAERREHADRFFYATDVPIKHHEFKLNLLADLISHAAQPDDIVIFLDGDSFPIAPVAAFLREKLRDYPLVAVRRDENNGDPQPHPSFCVTTPRFWRELPGDWRPGRTWTNPQGKEVTDVGGNLLGLLEDGDIEWYPMLRSNKVNPHPLKFGVYENLVYHQAGGLTVSAGGRLWRAAKQDELRKSLRGRLAARLPRKGRLGRLRRTINPVRRYQEALAAELGRIDAQVMDLIARDPDFYRQLIEPERGGELGELKAPVLLEDVKKLATKGPRR